MFHTYQFSINKDEVTQALDHLSGIRNIPCMEELEAQLRQAKKRCFRSGEDVTDIYLTLCDGEIIDLTNILDEQMHLSISGGIHPAVHKIYKKLIVHCG